jgi:cob(I)alamin adenosyltransferase
VYTKAGDYGMTSLYNGERRNKSDLVFDALGTIDELNSNVG